MLSLELLSLSFKYLLKVLSYSSTPALALSVSYFSLKQTALTGNLGLIPGSSSGYPIHNPQIGITYFGKFNYLVTSSDFPSKVPISTVPNPIDSAATTGFCIAIPTS